MALFAVKEINQWIKALSLDLCPEFVESKVGQASYPFQIAQKMQPIIVGIGIE